MSRLQGMAHGLSEHELSEIRMLIEERDGYLLRRFTRAIFLHSRGGTCAQKSFERGTDLLRAMRKSNLEYEALAGEAANAGNQLFSVTRRVFRSF